MDGFIHDEVSRRDYIQFHNSGIQTLDANICERLKELECKIEQIYATGRRQMNST